MLIDISSNFDFDFSKDFEEFEKDVNNALYKMAELTLAEEIVNQYFPFSTGATQNDDTSVQEGKENGNYYAEIVSTNPYVRRLYYHPEFNFYKGKNINAGALWHEKISQTFIEKTFQRLL